MFLTVKRLMALSFPTQREQFEQHIRVRWPRPVLLRPPFLLSWSAKAQFSGGWSFACALGSRMSFVGGCAPIHGCRSRGLGCHWWLRFVVGGGVLVCGWACHRSWTSVVVLGSWVIVVGGGWSFVSRWTVVRRQRFPFVGYGPSLVVLGHGCW
jgi:hypothetical protein